MCIFSSYSTTFAAAMEYQLDIHKDKAFYVSPRKDFTLIKGDSFSVMPDFDFKFDMIFADPPYFLSNGGISLQSGKVVSRWIRNGWVEKVDKEHFRKTATGVQVGNMMGREAS